jgi:phenylacetate-CoA ligase
MNSAFTFWILRILLSVRGVLSFSDTTYKILFLPGFEDLRWNIGKMKAWKVHVDARKSVPAYKRLLNKRKPASFEDIPITDKMNYVDAYSIEERCNGGMIPQRGVVIDESSGSSGVPHNWVRGRPERDAVKKILQIGLRNLMGNQSIFIINAFALGPWATGMNVSMSTVDMAILKSVGPDQSKIENTLKLFGTRYKYVIMGYPPFMKSFVDSTKLPLKKYDITVIFGGEGISEGMRDFLISKGFKRVLGSYGASDLEINIGAENEFTIALRKLLQTNEKLRERITKHEGLPMIFQYNPLDYYIESNEAGELIVTLCRASNVAPKIRYNIKDRGHVVRIKEIKRALADLGVVKSLPKIPIALPFLFLYGRADLAAAFFGCKITPAEIQQIIFEHGVLRDAINAFALITKEDTRLSKKLTLAIEVNKPIKNVTKWEKIIFGRLAEINQDFREASKMIPADSRPHIKCFNLAQGPFEKNDIRVKLRYVQKET